MLVRAVPYQPSITNTMPNANSATAVSSRAFATTKALTSARSEGRSSVGVSSTAASEAVGCGSSVSACSAMA